MALVRAAASEQDAAIFLTAAFTGLRRGELIALRWRDVDFAGSVVRVRSSYADGVLTTPKSGKVRLGSGQELRLAQPSGIGAGCPCVRTQGNAQGTATLSEACQPGDVPSCSRSRVSRRAIPSWEQPWGWLLRSEDASTDGLAVRARAGVPRDDRPVRRDEGLGPDAPPAVGSSPRRSALVVSCRYSPAMTASTRIRTCPAMSLVRPARTRSSIPGTSPVVSRHRSGRCTSMTTRAAHRLSGVSTTAGSSSPSSPPYSRETVVTSRRARPSSSTSDAASATARSAATTAVTSIDDPSPYSHPASSSQAVETWRPRQPTRAAPGLTAACRPKQKRD